MTTSKSLDDDLDVWADDDEDQDDEDDWTEDDLDPWSESPRAHATDPRAWLGDEDDDDW